jgi:hypothetical protein
MKKILVSNSIDILEAYKDIIINKKKLYNEKIVIDMSNYKEKNDSKIINKFEEFSKKENINIKFTNNENNKFK